MSNYVGYSPWQDAAQYGQGLGEVLGQILLNQPRLRAQQAMEQQRFPLEQQLLQAQIKNQNFQPQYRQDLLSMKQQSEADKARYEGENLDIRRGALANQAELNDERARHNMDTEESNKERQSWKEQHPTVPSAGAGLGEGLRGIKMVSDAAKGAAGAAGMSKDVPVHIDPKLEATAAQMAQQPGAHSIRLSARD